MSKILKFILIISLFLIFFVTGVFFYKNIKNSTEIENSPDYFQALAEQCLKKKDRSCCMASVEYMKKGNYKLIENNKCKRGFVPDMMKCVDSFRWCEPIK